MVFMHAALRLIDDISEGSVELQASNIMLIRALKAPRRLCKARVALSCGG